ncbi:MAG: hypothetical protein AB4042_15600 [Leptolyngbyaceae cyanobacterium]
MAAPIKLLIPFEALAEAIAHLEQDELLRLRHLLDQHLNNDEENEMQSLLAERGCQLPLKEGLSLTPEVFQSGESSVSTEHDHIAAQNFEAEP